MCFKGVVYIMILFFCSTGVLVLQVMNAHYILTLCLFSRSIKYCQKLTSSTAKKRYWHVSCSLCQKAPPIPSAPMAVDIPQKNDGVKFMFERSSKLTEGVTCSYFRNMPRALYSESQSKFDVMTNNECKNSILSTLCVIALLLKQRVLEYCILSLFNFH